MTAAAEMRRPTLELLGPADQVAVRLVTSAQYRRPLTRLLGELRIGLAAGSAAADTLIIGAASVDEGIELCADWHGSSQPRLLIANRFTAAGALRALRHDIRVLLSFDDLNPARLLSAVESARHGDSRLSADVVTALLRGGGGQGNRLQRSAAPSQVTGRQREVLALMAVGHGNAAIAKLLGCSEHTVKNVIYELMARLGVRNRAHAVAYAVRTGLI